MILTFEIKKKQIEIEKCYFFEKGYIFIKEEFEAIFNQMFDRYQKDVRKVIARFLLLPGNNCGDSFWCVCSLQERVLSCTR